MSHIPRDGFKAPVALARPAGVKKGEGRNLGETRDDPPCVVISDAARLRRLGRGDEFEVSNMLGGGCRIVVLPPVHPAVDCDLAMKVVSATLQPGATCERACFQRCVVVGQAVNNAVRYLLREIAGGKIRT